MPDVLDELYERIDDNDPGAFIRLATIRSIGDDGLTAEVESLQGAGRTNALLLQFRLTTTEEHSHVVPGVDTETAGLPPGRHAHGVAERESEPVDGHTHQILYRVGDVGLLIYANRATPIFMGVLH